MGRLSLAKSEYSKAKAFYEKLLDSAEKSRKADDLFAAATGLGLACEGLKDDNAAADYFRRALNHVEEMRSSLAADQREQFFDVKVNGFYRTAPYEGLARVQMRMNKATEAWNTSEYSKARLFAEAMSRRTAGATFDLPKALQDTDQVLMDQLSALKKQRQAAYEKDNNDRISELEPRIRQLEEQFAAHKKMVREKFPLFAATKYPEPMDLSQTDLKDNERVLTYHVTDPGLIIYFTKGNSIVKAVLKPVSRKEIGNLVLKFRASFEVGGQAVSPESLANFDFTCGRQLADLLLSDILPDLPKDAQLLIVPDGPLGVVPFEMLVLNQSGKVGTDKTIPYVTGAEFFGDRNPISYYQSVTALTLARTLGKHQKTGGRTLAVVDPVFSSEDARLAKAAAEKRRATLGKLTEEKLMSFQTELKLEVPRLPLTGQLGESLKKADPEKTDLYHGVTAQKAVLLHKDLKPYRSVVFGTHGYFGKDLPGIQEPALILTLPDQPEGQDGFLRMTEVMSLKLNCEVAALTACQTGLGRHISGEGTMGMGRAFQYAGAKSVLITLWSVAESSSVDLVTSFFKHLREGKSKLEALELARDEIRKAGYDHPFFWAPFILVGEAD